jgi:tetratricopeptide (TPR) repeat protein
MMVHASYVMLIHVGFIAQMHNLFLELAVQQGIPGMMALIGLIILAALALRSRLIHQGPSPLLYAAIISLTALTVHGMFDAAVYASHMVPLALLPIGFALGLAPRQEKKRTVHARKTTWGLAGLLALGLLWLLTPTARSAFLSNLGAVEQTRAELSVYSWPEWGIQDEVRRSPDVNLAPAIAYYQAALALNPDNVSANRRLGQIQLSLGQYAEAHEHLQRAYDEAAWQQANRFLLGESEAVSGNIDQAAALWRTVSGKLWWDQDWIGPQLFRKRQWWYEHIGEKQKAAWISEVIDRVTATEQEKNP